MHLFFCTLSSNDLRVYKVNTRVHGSKYHFANIYCLGSLMFTIAVTFFTHRYLTLEIWINVQRSEELMYSWKQECCFR